MYIQSDKNKIVKEINALKLKKNRDKLGLFVAEGERLVKEALHKAEYIVSSESFESDIKADYILKDSVFQKVCDTVNPQGILAVCKITKNEYKSNIKNPFYIMLENIQDPGNMGTIIRTADAAGADGIFLSKGCVDVYNPKVLRSTMGSLFHLPVYTNMDLKGIVKNIDSPVIAAHLKGEKTPYDINMKNGAVILIGNEGNGLTDELSNMADELVKIPMSGKAESMNAAVAAAILIYEAVRQRL